MRLLGWGYICYRCGAKVCELTTKASAFIVNPPEGKISMVLPCFCFGEPGEVMAGPVKFRPVAIEKRDVLSKDMSGFTDG